MSGERRATASGVFSMTTTKTRVGAVADGEGEGGGGGVELVSEVALGIARGVAVGVGPLCAMGVHAAMSSTANRGARNKRIAPEFPRRSASRTRLGTMRRPRRDGRRSKRNAAKASWATFENLAQRLGRVRVAALRRVVVRFRVAFRFAAELDRVARARAVR